MPKKEVNISRHFYFFSPGPSFWGLINPQWMLCNKGRRQSPIDIEPAKMLYDPNLRPLSVDKHKVVLFSWFIILATQWRGLLFHSLSIVSTYIFYRRKRFLLPPLLVENIVCPLVKRLYQVTLDSGGDVAGWRFVQMIWISHRSSTWTTKKKRKEKFELELHNRIRYLKFLTRQTEVPPQTLDKIKK